MYYVRKDVFNMYVKTYVLCMYRRMYYVVCMYRRIYYVLQTFVLCMNRRMYYVCKDICTLYVKTYVQCMYKKTYYKNECRFATRAKNTLQLPTLVTVSAQEVDFC